MCQAPRVLTWVRLSLWLWKNSPAARKDEELLPALETGKPSCGCPAGEVTGDVHKGRKRVNRTVQYHPVAERSEVELRGSILMDLKSNEPKIRCKTFLQDETNYMVFENMEG